MNYTPKIIEVISRWLGDKTEMLNESELQELFLHLRDKGYGSFYKNTLKKKAREIQLGTINLHQSLQHGYTTKSPRRPGRIGRLSRPIGQTRKGLAL